jgi:hypothetical protein
MDQSKPLPENGPPESADGLPVTPPQDLKAWEEIENGRFRPRRIRGSCLGMELG